MNKDGTGLKRIPNNTVYAPAWSPDRKWLAFMEVDWQARIHPNNIFDEPWRHSLSYLRYAKQKKTTV